MNQLKIDKCYSCKGNGKIDKITCPVCEGYGVWEYIPDVNDAAVTYLLNPCAVVSDEAKKICNDRITTINANNPLASMNLASTVIDDPKITALEDLHSVGAERWGWAWLHTNRFAIELLRLHGVNPKIHSHALANLAWLWLESEGQVRT
jgi:hypothetical protein